MASYELEGAPFPEGRRSHGGYHLLPTQDQPPPYEDNKPAAVYPPRAPVLAPTVQQQQSSVSELKNEMWYIYKSLD